MAGGAVDRWLERCAVDTELAAQARGLNVSLEIAGSTNSRFVTLADPVRLDGDQFPLRLRLRAEDAAWEQLLSGPHPPGWQSFGAIRRFNDAFAFETDSSLLEAQALAALERMLEIAIDPPNRPNVPVRWSPKGIDISTVECAVTGGKPAQIRVMTAGFGPPILFLHTAGADSRQFLYQLGDPALAASYRLVAFDLPGHGASGLEGEFGDIPRIWRATGGQYLAWCCAAIETLCKVPPIVVGCSAGAAMALTLAARYPQLVRGTIALETPYKAQGRRTAFLDHARISNGRHNQAWVRGLMAPNSPKPHRDEACGIYQQARPGIYDEDLRFYTEEFDAGTLVDDLNRQGRSVVLCTGAYDYSATPTDAHRIADAVTCCVARTMPDLGHFPMIESPGTFAPYLHDALANLEERT